MRRLMLSEEGEKVGEWTLLKDFNFTEDENEVVLTELNSSEIYIEARGLVNISASTQSAARILINGKEVGNLETQNNSSPNADKFQKISFQYNELYWKSEKTPQCNGDADTYNFVFTNLLTTYMYRSDIGIAETLAIRGNNQNYAIISGNVKIYGR